MNHRWEKIDKKSAVCKVCGCERLRGAYGMYIYARATQVKLDGFECIDWKVENSKTID